MVANANWRRSTCFLVPATLVLISGWPINAVLIQRLDGVHAHNIGEAVLLVCITNETATPVNWEFQQNGSTKFVPIFKGGSVTVEYRQRFNATYDNNGLNNLHIVNLSRLDAGVYKCREQAGFGPDESLSNLTVHDYSLTSPTQSLDTAEYNTPYTLEQDENLLSHRVQSVLVAVGIVIIVVLLCIPVIIGVVRYRKKKKGQPLRTEMNILLIGETGIGKSTLINAFAAYFTYPTFKDACRAVRKASHQKAVVAANENKKVGQSVTEKPRAYSYRGSNITVRLIDTPGFGDTRGPRKDSENCRAILNEIVLWGNLHGICILLKPQEKSFRLTFQYITLELFSRLHKEACKNIVVCFTHSRDTFFKPGDSMVPLRRLLTEHNIDIQLDPKTVYFVDNESMKALESADELHKYSNFDLETYMTSWDNSVKEITRLMQHFSALSPHCVEKTASITEARSMMLYLTKTSHPDRIKESEDLMQCCQQFARYVDSNAICSYGKGTNEYITNYKDTRELSTAEIDQWLSMITDEYDRFKAELKKSKENDIQVLQHTEVKEKIESILAMDIGREIATGIDLVDRREVDESAVKVIPFKRYCIASNRLRDWFKTAQINKGAADAGPTTMESDVKNEDDFLITTSVL